MRWLGIAMLGAAVAGCSIGAREVDYSPQRGYSADINAALDHGPTATQPGVSERGEPIGAVPWQAHDANPNGS